MKHLPNFLTCLNLLCGCIGIVFAFEGNLVWSAYMVGIAAVLDFLDGFLARLLNVRSEIGKQLDSLADMVTFGVLPGVVMYKLISISVDISWLFEGSDDAFVHYFGRPIMYLFPYFGFIIPVFSAIRLAKFNIDTRQADNFIGLPTPANAIFLSSIGLCLFESAGLDGLFFLINHDQLANVDIEMLKSWPNYLNVILYPGFLIGLTIIMSLLLIAPLPLFALKFKSFAWKGNEIRYIFLLSCIFLVVLFGYAGISFSIITYMLLSLVNNFLNRNP